MEEEGRNYEQDWEEMWKDIVLDEKGNINLDQVKRELSDYRGLIENATEIICEVTGDTLSYPNYPARTVLDIFEDKYLDKQIAGEDMVDLIKKSGNLEEILQEVREYFNLGEDE